MKLFILILAFQFLVSQIFASTTQRNGGNVPSHITLSLTNGYYGRLEVYYNGQWGTVCDDNFGHAEAEAVCRYLGYSGYNSYKGSGFYGQGSGCIIGMDDLDCHNQYTLRYCSFNGWGNNNCGHGEDVGVQCRTSFSGSYTSQYVTVGGSSGTGSDGYCGSSVGSGNPATPIRLVGGNNFYEGRVEIYHSGHWGTICDDSFGFNEADVVCKMLGFKGFSQLYKAPSQYGSSHDKIWLDDVRCNGYEPDIANCRSGGWGVNNCGHEEDIWIGCDIFSSTDNPMTMTTDSPSVSKSVYPYYNKGNGYSTNGYGYGYTSYGYGYSTRGPQSAYDIGLSYRCSLNNWDVQIYLPSFFNYFPGYVLSDIFLGQDECTGTMDGYYLNFNHELGKCGTTEQVNYNTIEFSNTMTYAIHDPLRHFIIREYKLRIKVKCNLPREETVSKEIVQEQASLPNYWNGFGPSPSTYTLNMQFFDDANFNYMKYGNPVTARIGEKVYVRVYTDIALDNIKMRLNNCYTKPTPMSSDRLRFYLIRNGCSDDPGSRVVLRTSHETRFVFQDFEYSVNHKSLYLYCEANFCRETDYSPVCNRVCSDNRKRKRPSLTRRNETDGTTMTEKNNTSNVDVHTATVSLQINFVKHDVKRRNAMDAATHSSGERIPLAVHEVLILMTVGIFVLILRS